MGWVVWLLVVMAGIGQVEGKEYGKQGIEVYAQTRHGPDGALFLDPYFVPYLLDLEGQVVLDAGCGAGPWAILAAQQGATVYGIDIQEGMIEKALQASKEAGVEDKTHFVVGDVGQLPYPDNFFDRAISINVGCNLADLEPHIKELHRVLKDGGIAVITAPTSFGTVFTDGKRLISDVLTTIENSLTDDQEAFPQSLKGLDEVYRATFAQVDGRWSLILNDSLLEHGEPIWRKIPKMMVPNYFHCECEYFTLFEDYNFTLRQVCRPYFASEQERQHYNRDHTDTLGSQYVSHPPFVIFVIEKRPSS